MPRVELISKAGCHLCDDALEVVSRVCRDLGVDWVVLYIEDNPGLAALYFEAVPVVRIDGRGHAQFRVDEPRLRAALAPA